MVVVCPLGGGGLHHHLPLAWACIAVLRYEGLLYFFADLSIVLGFPISFSFPWWADHRVMVSVGGHLGILGIFFFFLCGHKGPPGGGSAVG